MPPFSRPLALTLDGGPKQGIVIKPPTASKGYRYHIVEYQPWEGGPTNAFTWNVKMAALEVLHFPPPTVADDGLEGGAQAAVAAATAPAEDGSAAAAEMEVGEEGDPAAVAAPAAEAEAPNGVSEERRRTVDGVVGEGGGGVEEQKSSEAEAVVLVQAAEAAAVSTAAPAAGTGETSRAEDLFDAKSGRGTGDSSLAADSTPAVEGGESGKKSDGEGSGGGENTEGRREKDDGMRGGTRRSSGSWREPTSKRTTRAATRPLRSCTLGRREGPDQGSMSPLARGTRSSTVAMAESASDAEPEIDVGGATPAECETSVETMGVEQDADDDCAIAETATGELIVEEDTSAVESDADSPVNVDERNQVPPLCPPSTPPTPADEMRAEEERTTANGEEAGADQTTAEHEDGSAAAAAAVVVNYHRTTRAATRPSPGRERPARASLSPPARGTRSSTAAMAKNASDTETEIDTGATPAVNETGAEVLREEEKGEDKENAVTRTATGELNVEQASSSLAESDTENPSTAAESGYSHVPPVSPQSPPRPSADEVQTEERASANDDEARTDQTIVERLDSSVSATTATTVVPSPRTSQAAAMTSRAGTLRRREGPGQGSPSSLAHGTRSSTAAMAESPCGAEAEIGPGATPAESQTCLAALPEKEVVDKESAVLARMVELDVEKDMSAVEADTDSPTNAAKTNHAPSASSPSTPPAPEDEERVAEERASPNGEEIGADHPMVMADHGDGSAAAAAVAATAQSAEQPTQRVATEGDAARDESELLAAAHEVEEEQDAKEQQEVEEAARVAEVNSLAARDAEVAKAEKASADEAKANKKAKATKAARDARAGGAMATRTKPAENAKAAEDAKAAEEAARAAQDAEAAAGASAGTALVAAETALVHPEPQQAMEEPTQAEMQGPETVNTETVLHRQREDEEKAEEASRNEFGGGRRMREVEADVTHKVSLRFGMSSILSRAGGGGAQSSCGWQIRTNVWCVYC